MAQYLIAPHGRPTSIAQSLGAAQEPGNPTVLPISELKKFHFTFLIRHPRRSIPSYWRCTISPRKEVTGWDYFDPAEAGYAELVVLFKFLDEQGIIDKANVTVIDADDMLDNPEGIIRAYCDKTGIDFKDTMLNWNKEDDAHAQELFEKWNGWHDDALKTSCLQARAHPKVSILPLCVNTALAADNLFRRCPLSKWKTKNGRTSLAPKRKRSFARRSTTMCRITTISSNLPLQSNWTDGTVCSLIITTLMI